MNEGSHELIGAFEAVGLPLCRTLREMLSNHPSHCTERRGCGYTQATRFVASYINRDRDPYDASDLGLFDHFPVSESERIGKQAVKAGWAPGWRSLEQASPPVHLSCQSLPSFEHLLRIPQQLVEVRTRLELEESRLYLDLVESLLTRESHSLPKVAGMPEKPEIGSCSQAEEFFLEVAHGRIRRGGQANVFVDANGRPVLVEKIGLGESHSAISIQPLTINDVVLPPGSLFAVRYSSDVLPTGSTPKGNRIALHDIEQARFLRLTTLAAAPAWRRRAFNAQVDAQERRKFLSPCTTTLDDLRGFAATQVAKAA